MGIERNYYWVDDYPVTQETNGSLDLWGVEADFVGETVCQKV